MEKTELPAIHYCAVQSTKQAEELGFRNRDGKDQYRLVELDAEGKLVPVAVTKTNTMFFSAEEVIERIPNLYERIPYERLIGMQKELHEAKPEEKKLEKAEKTETPEHKETLTTGKEAPGVGIREIPEQKGMLEVTGFQVDQGVVMARVQYNGEESLEGIWKKGEELYILTGMEVNHSLEKYSFREGDKKELQTYLRENHLEAEEKYQMLVVETEKEPHRNMEQNMQETKKFLEGIQKKEMEKNYAIRPVEMELQL